MEASLLASILSKLAAGGRAELRHDELALVPEAERHGLISSIAADPADDARLEELRARLAAVRGTSEEAKVRSELLDLSDRVAENRGGVDVIAAADGAYRGGQATVGHYRLTHAGRALLGDLGPRASRVAGMTYERFKPAIAALRARMEERASRARVIMGGVQAVSASAARLSAIGVAARKESADVLNGYFRALYTETSTERHLSDPERWSLVESAILAVGPLPDASPVMRTIVHLRNRLDIEYASGKSEDALDAAVLLAPWPEVQRNDAIAAAARLAQHVRLTLNLGLPLATALIVERSRPGDELAAARLVGLARELTTRGASPDDALVAGAILAVSDADVPWLAARTEALHAYVARFSPVPLIAACAALAILEGDVAEIIDDLRIASAAAQKHLVSETGAEAIGLAIKQLLIVAALALGDEGDAEEFLALKPRLAENAFRLGVAGFATSLPLVTAAAAAFHAPLLTAHAIALQAAPMHSSYVFGSQGSYGYGHGSWGGGGRSWG